MLKQTKVQHVDHNQVVCPVEHVEHEEDGGEEVHGHPVHPLVRHLDLLPDTPAVPLVVAPLPVHLLERKVLLFLIASLSNVHLRRTRTLISTYLFKLIVIAVQRFSLIHLCHWARWANTSLSQLHCPTSHQWLLGACGMVVGGVVAGAPVAIGVAQDLEECSSGLEHNLITGL